MEVPEAFHITNGMGIKDALLRKMMQSKMKGLPKDQQDKIFKALEDNPEFFTDLGKEIQEEIKKGKDQMSATMEVVGRHREKLEQIMK